MTRYGYGDPQTWPRYRINQHFDPRFDDPLCEMSLEEKARQMELAAEQADYDLDRDDQYFLDGDY